MCRYILTNSKWLDTQLFLPENRDKFYHWGIPNELDSTALYDDPNFATSHDHIVAKLFAYSRLHRFCQKQMNSRTQTPDFRGGAETEFNVIPLLQQHERLTTGAIPDNPLSHIPRNELDHSLERFMQARLRTLGAADPKSGNIRISRRMKRRLRRFLAILRAEKRDIESEIPTEPERTEPEDGGQE